MKKTMIFFAGIVGLLAVILYMLYLNNPAGYGDSVVIADSAKNATYIVEGQKVTLVNGFSSTEIAPGSAIKITTKYFGNEVNHDLNGDGRQDVAFIITQDAGGTGVFYYVVAALNTANGYVGSDAVFLGDRIAPQSTNMGKGNIIVVNYADRKFGESFGFSPSVGKSKWLILDTNTMQFGEVAQNFEGEVDTTRMTLGMKTWDWVNTLYNNDTQVDPKLPNKFTITFKSDKTFSATTDCNQVSGQYSVSGLNITLSKMVSTMMFCQGSQEADFTGALAQVQSYMFTSRGQLVMLLKMDTGSMVFK